MIKSYATLRIGELEYCISKAEISVTNDGELKIGILPLSLAPDVTIWFSKETFNEIVDFEEWQDDAVVDLTGKK